MRATASSQQGGNKTIKALVALRAARRIVLTGTPSCRTTWTRCTPHPHTQMSATAIAMSAEDLSPVSTLWVPKAVHRKLNMLAHPAVLNALWVAPCSFMRWSALPAPDMLGTLAAFRESLC